MMNRPVLFKNNSQPIITEYPDGPDFYVKMELTQGVERLPLKGPFSYPGLVRMATLKGSSSLLHAIANSAYVNYRKGTLTDGKVVSQTDWVKELRSTLAKYLREPHSKSGGQVSYYNSLFGGDIVNIAKTNPEYRLENMEKKLRSDENIGVEFIHYIAEFLDLDIYVIDLAIMDIYNYGANDFSLYLKGRTSVVVGYINDHFETIAIKRSPQTYDMPFFPDNKLIVKIKARLEQQKKEMK